MLLIGDVVLIMIAIFFSYLIKNYITMDVMIVEKAIERLDLKQSLIIAIQVFSLYLFDLYNPNRLMMTSTIKLVSNLIISIALGGVIISGVYYFFSKYIFGRQVLLTYILILGVMMPLWRYFIQKLITISVSEKKLLVVGLKQNVESFVNEFKMHQNTGVNIERVLLINENNKEEGERLIDVLREENFDIIAYDITHAKYSVSEIDFLFKQKYSGKAIYDFPNFLKNFTGKIHLNYIDSRWLLGDDRMQGYENRPYVMFKRSFDIALSLLLILMTAPFMILIAIIIKLNSKGTIFFTQERLGCKEVEFKCYKFRTMRQNAEQISGPTWCDKNDPRLDTLGRLLRKTRLDELPQLLNILNGEMSFFGPRPIRRYFAQKLSKEIPFYNIRFNVRPGLSGWAQVNIGYCGSFEEQREKFMYELFYIQNMSLILDMLIFIKTIRKMLWAQGV